MNSVTADSTAVMRIAALLDEGSFVEIGGAITARSTDFNCRMPRHREMVSLQDMV